METSGVGPIGEITRNDRDIYNEIIMANQQGDYENNREVATQKYSENNSEIAIG